MYGKRDVLRPDDSQPNLTEADLVRVFLNDGPCDIDVLRRCILVANAKPVQEKAQAF